MKSLHNSSEQLRQDLRGVVHDIEGIVQGLTDATSDQAIQLKDKARATLDNARHSLDAIERSTATHLRAAGNRTQRYVHQRPWLVIGAAATAAYVLGMLTRFRR